MSRRAGPLLWLVALTLALASCGRPGGGTGASRRPPFEVPGPLVPTTRVTLSRSYRFQPAAIEIRVGDTVTWTNRDDFPHNVELLDESGRKVNLPVGASGSLTFDRPGVIYYHCSIHPQQMHGKIVVRPG